MSTHREIAARTDASIGTSDYAAYQAARDGSENLLRAQLRAGQHLLPLALACAVGATLGLARSRIRPAAGDPACTLGGIASGQL